MEFHSEHPNRQEIFRVGRKPDPWEPPDWAFGPGGNPVNRYDDPKKRYRVAYASLTPYGCYLETLAHFRSDPKVVAELNEIEDSSLEPPPLGVVPLAWFETRELGVANVSGAYADVSHSVSIAYINRKLAALIGQRGDYIDAAALRMTAPRSLTQAVSALAYEDHFNGVRYQSRYGDDVVNMAVFEPFDVIFPQPSRIISPSDPEFQRAMETLGLRLQTAEEAV